MHCDRFLLTHSSLYFLQDSKKIIARLPKFLCSRFGNIRKKYIMPQQKDIEQLQNQEFSYFSILRKYVFLARHQSHIHDFYSNCVSTSTSLELCMLCGQKYYFWMKHLFRYLTHLRGYLVCRLLLVWNWEFGLKDSNWN